MNMREKLLAERADSLAELRSLTTKDDFAAGDQHRYEVLMARVSGIDHELRRRDVELRLDEKKADQLDEKRVRELLFGGGDSGRNIDHRAGKDATFRSLFGGPAPSTGFRDFGEFLTAVHLGMADQRLVPAASQRTLLGGVGSVGGFLVPDQYAAELLDSAREAEIVRPRARVFGMQSDTLKIAGFSGSDHSSTIMGGFAGAWLAENATATRETPEFRQVELAAKKLAIYTQASNELVGDAPRFEATLAAAMSEAVAWYLDYAFLNGDGAGMPLGILHDPALIAVTSNAGAGSVVMDDLIAAFGRLYAAGRSRATWIISTEVVPTLYTLKDDNGDYLLTPEQRGAEPTILGLPVLVTEKLPQIGTLGDILLCDLSQYGVGLRREVTLEKSVEPGWLQDATDYRCVVRADGMGLWSGPVTPKHGGDTLSWCVGIATRS